MTSCNIIIWYIKVRYIPRAAFAREEDHCRKRRPRARIRSRNLVARGFTSLREFCSCVYYVLFAGYEREFDDGIVMRTYREA